VVVRKLPQLKRLQLNRLRLPLLKLLLKRLKPNKQIFDISKRVGTYVLTFFLLPTAKMSVSPLWHTS
jgi:hypothetical protein